jgi:hypothetical protein
MLLQLLAAAAAACIQHKDNIWSAAGRFIAEKASGPEAKGFLSAIEHANEDHENSHACSDGERDCVKVIQNQISAG